TTEGRIRSRILLSIYSLPRLRLLRRALQDCTPDDMNQFSRVKGWHDEVVRSALQHVDIELDIDETRYHDHRDRCRSSACGLERVCPGAVSEGGVGQYQHRRGGPSKHSTGLGAITNAPRAHSLIEQDPLQTSDGILLVIDKQYPQPLRHRDHLGIHIE